MRVTYEEIHGQDWGGFKPKVVVEYDEENSYLISIDITYNRRKASLVFNYRELKEKIKNELDAAEVRTFISLRLFVAFDSPGALASTIHVSRHAIWNEQTV